MPTDPVAAAPAFAGPDTPSPALIDTCVHCGFCLPTCPTYLLWGEEMDSPRGRIYLMKAGVEGRAAMESSFVQHFDRCLGCLACVTACPSGVQYGPLIEKTRAQVEQRFDRPLSDRMFRNLLMWFIPYEGRLRAALLPLALFAPVVRLLAGLPVVPKRLRAALAVAPPVSLASLFARPPERTEAAGEQRLRVAILSGCVQKLAFAPVNDATVRVLAAEGCQVLAPAAQGCCGALPLHAGHIEHATTSRSSKRPASTGSSSTPPAAARR